MKRAAFALVLLAGCTQLGPMPATTGISAMPIGRPGVEAQVGAVPGFYASQSAQNSAEGTTIGHASVLLDPDRWLPVKGLLVGGRVFGKEDDTPIEPYLGYRRRLIDRLALGVIGFGSTKRTEKYARYHGFRLGGEVMADIEVYAPSPWFRLHAQGAISATRMVVSGRYCVDDAGVGTDCNQDESLNTVINGKFSGVYTAGTAQIVADIGKREGVFHSARFALLGTAGQMPLVLNGEENGTDLYYSLGLSFSVALGIGRPASTE